MTDYVAGIFLYQSHKKKKSQTLRSDFLTMLSFVQVPVAMAHTLACLHQLLFVKSR